MIQPKEPQDEQSVTADEYDQWLTRNSLSARWVRFWFAPERTLFLNTPVRGLPGALDLKPEHRLLDIGCGYGGSLIYLQRRIGFVRPPAGLDCSRVMLAGARRAIRARGMQKAIGVQWGRATDLPYAGGSFDVVLCMYVIKHLSDPLLRRMLHEVKRVLRPGGRVCVWEAGPSRRAFMQAWNLRLLRAGVSRVHLRPADMLQRFMEEAGFANLRPYGQGPYLFYPPLPRVGFIAESHGPRIG